jgi:hypothetical protein
MMSRREAPLRTPAGIHRQAELGRDDHVRAAASERFTE